MDARAPQLEDGVRGDALRISYVGEAGSRIDQHLHGLLGGGYDLYEEAHFDEGRSPEETVAYRRDPESMNSVFLDDYETLSERAYQNATGYRFFWAPVEGPPAFRKVVETALIQWAKKHDEPLQNLRLSCLACEGAPRRIHSEFEGSIRPAMLREDIVCV